MTTYKTTGGYLRYRNQTPTGEAGLRQCDLMPPLLHNENGDAVVVPGEIYCRHRDLDGTLCTKRQALSSPSALRTHYRVCHGMNLEHRRIGANGVGFQTQLNRWYLEVMDGRMPTWAPRKAVDPSINILSDKEPGNDDDNDDGGGDDRPPPSSEESSNEESSSKEPTSSSSSSESSSNDSGPPGPIGPVGSPGAGPAPPPSDITGFKSNASPDELLAPLWNSHTQTWRWCDMRRAVHLDRNERCSVCAAFDPPRLCPPHCIDDTCAVWQVFENPFD